MSFQDYTNEPQSFFQRYRIAIVVGGFFTLIAGTVASILIFSGKPTPPKPPEMIVIHLQSPPPPPPPPPPLKPPPPPPLQQKMVMQPPMQKAEVKPKDVAKDLPKPPGPPSPPASGPPSDFGLAGPGSGGGGDGGGGGSRWGWYAGEVQTAIADALRRNDKTRGANLQLKVRIWSDTNGLVTRAELIGSSGDSELDRTIRSDVLTGLHLQEPPPQGMPMPIVMVIREQRPS